jgi:hypothetical protein
MPGKVKKNTKGGVLVDRREFKEAFSFLDSARKGDYFKKAYETPIAVQNVIFPGHLQVT